MFSLHADTARASERKRPLPTWLCMVSPFVLGLAYVTMGLHIRLGLGHWPRPMTENYQLDQTNSLP
jgi:hypothetical protein